MSVLEVRKVKRLMLKFRNDFASFNFYFLQVHNTYGGLNHKYDSKVLYQLSIYTFIR